MDYSIGTEDNLLVRLSNMVKSKKKFTFLVGSGLTCPTAEYSIGVSSVIEIIQRIRTKLEEFGASELDLNIGHSGAVYQHAMSQLLLNGGQDELNLVIKEAVLNARINSEVTIAGGNLTEKDLEHDINNWFLRPGVEALGRLFVHYRQSFTGPILTSNFDPLLEISTRKNGGNPTSHILSQDGSFTTVLADRTIVHFHGYWYGGDTLHTPDQIRRNRPNLKGSLKKLLSNSSLVVMGYGGWDDMFTKTLVEIVSEGSEAFDVLWTFYSSDDKDIEKNNTLLFQNASNAIGQRIVLYKGIDADSFLPKLLDSLGGIHSVPIKRRAISDNPIFNFDNPPTNNYWVGRETEIELISNSKARVVFITGIGGQGKSGLASHYVQSVVSLSNEWEMWDWRDFKEEDNRFHGKLVSTIERISNARIRPSQLNDHEIQDVIDVFFDELGDRRIVFVCDNVDKYIDLEKFQPSGGLGLFVHEALKRNHQSKFVFTCRPEVQITAENFLPIKLRGLNLEETKELFLKHKMGFSENEIMEYATEAHTKTRGHVLWLNIIAAHSIRGRKEFEGLLHSISGNSQDDTFSGLARDILIAIWENLNINQRILLRGLAETVKAESEEILHKILESELNANKFYKSLRTLKALNLIVVKSSLNRKDLLELHPLVKQFIIEKFPNTIERNRFITLFVKYYNQLILVFKPTLSYNSPYDVFETYTSKIELETNQRDFKSALASLFEIEFPIITAGYVEDYLRVSYSLLTRIDWTMAIAEEYLYFHNVLRYFIQTLIDFGNFQDSELFLIEYEKRIPDKGINYILLCDLKCYFHWFKKDNLEEAIFWGEKAIEMQTQSKVDLPRDLTHNYALALRDTMEKDNVGLALGYFLKGENLAVILNPDTLDISLGGSFYGNIGRCLFFSGQFNDSLICYKKSIRVFIDNEKDTETESNLGYAWFWVGEVYEAQNRFEDAYYSYRQAFNHFNKATSRPRKQMVGDALDNLIGSHASMRDLDYRKPPEREIEKKCRKILTA
jgi:tetratricopeptide (TPR) repeat protein